MYRTEWISEFGTRAMKPIGVGKEEDGFFKFGNFIVHLMLFDVRFEAGQAVGSSLAMSNCEDVFRILPDFLCDSAPSSFNCCGRVRESTILHTFISAS